MRTNFTQCEINYTDPSHYAENIKLYGYNGSVVQLERNLSTQFSTQGCLQFCGDGTDWYRWEQQASTMTTWVLPVVGILLQAPFTSNAFWETIFALARWIGSPMASLSYILWNIKVSGKCALLVDLAVPFGNKDVRRETDFSSVRDSFYILMTMNQYTMKERVRRKKEAEGLLRIALFSKDLRLLKLGHEPQGSASGIVFSPAFTSNRPTTPPPPRQDSDLESADELNNLRQDLAEELRAKRRRGVVPVFISTLWFVFSLGLSIQAAFGFLGENAQAHDLALGLLLAWLPVLILSSIVDRNPVAADDIRIKLNELVERVRSSLTDNMVKNEYLESIQKSDRTDMRKRLGEISQAISEREDFFADFAGQGRKRFFYGCAHPILTDIEQAYIAEKGRYWLQFEAEARTKLVLGDVSGGLDWLDPRELWQVLSAVTIVGGTILGAFVLSYFTPTVGLGCRSGGYTVFGVVAFGLLVVEMMCWWAFDASKPPIVEKTRRYTASAQDFVNRHSRQRMRGSSAVQAFRDFSQEHSSKIIPHSAANFAKKRLRYCWNLWQKSKPQARVDCVFFKPVECFNFIWLVYITMAQTTGAYNTCKCKSSLWGGGGGYIDWNADDIATTKYVRRSWAIGTVLSSSIMAFAMVYIVTEWCLQSHLSTANPKDAARGLRLTQQFRRLTSPFRDFMHYIIEGGYLVRQLLSKLQKTHSTDDNTSKTRQNRRSVRWTKDAVLSDARMASTSMGEPMMDFLPGQHRPSSERSLMGSGDESVSPASVAGADAASRSSMCSPSMQSPRGSHDDQAVPEIQSPSLLHVPGRRSGHERRGSDTSLSV